VAYEGAMGADIFLKLPVLNISLETADQCGVKNEIRSKPFRVGKGFLMPRQLFARVIFIIYHNIV
jgi:hypothetical protein